MRETYLAMQIKAPGQLELVERRVPLPSPREVLLAVEACGICGADVTSIERPGPSTDLPRVPGHEVVGRIVAIGKDVASIWRVGQRVGVGRLGGACLECASCRQGHFHLCPNQPFIGSTQDGGYAEMMLARGTALISIPDELSSEEAAPILCAGIATFNALKKCGAEAGDLVGVHGIGGLGHMALQYARRMGFKVVAVGRGGNVAAAALQLGAHLYVDTNQSDAAQCLKDLGGAKAIITTVTNADATSKLVAGLAPEGRLMLLGVGKDPLAVSPGFFVVGERSVLGSITGSPYETEKALNFSVLTGVRPVIETVPLEAAAEAYQKMKSGDATFRMVLTVRKDRHAEQ